MLSQDVMVRKVSKINFSLLSTLHGMSLAVLILVHPCESTLRMIYVYSARYSRRFTTECSK